MKIECIVKKNPHKLAYLMIGGLSLMILIFSEKVKAEDFRDQQDRMREEYYQEQENERVWDSYRIEQDIRENQYEQQLRTQDQILEMKQEKIRMDQTRHDVQKKQADLERKRLREDKAINERQRNMTPAELEAQKKLIEERKNQESPIDFKEEKQLKNALELN